jgi:uncharacterized protein YciW
MVKPAETTRLPYAARVLTAANIAQLTGVPSFLTVYDYSLKHKVIVVCVPKEKINN